MDGSSSHVTCWWTDHIFIHSIILYKCTLKPCEMILKLPTYMSKIGLQVSDRCPREVCTYHIGIATYDPLRLCEAR